MKLLRRRGQSTGEYAILFAIVLGAVVAMQAYIRNRIASGIRARGDVYFTQATKGLAGVKVQGPDQTSVSTSRSKADASAVDKVVLDQTSKGSSFTPN